jgi:hypothetical protein
MQTIQFEKDIPYNLLTSKQLADSVSTTRLDSASAFWFVEEVTGRIPETFKTLYAELGASKFIPFCNYASPTDRVVRFRIVDGVGRPEFVAGDRDTDTNFVDAISREEEYKLYSNKLTLDFTQHDIDLSRATGRSLLDFKYELVAEAHAQNTNQLMLFGNTNPYIRGWVDHPEIDKSSVAVGESGSTDWDQKTPQEILNDISFTIRDVALETGGRHIIDTIALPYTKWYKLNNTYRTQNSNETLSQSLRSLFPNLRIDPLMEIENKFDNNTKQGFIAYQNNSRYFGYELSQPVWSPIRELGDWSWKTSLYFKHGGIVLIYPKSQIIKYGI